MHLDSPGHLSQFLFFLLFFYFSMCVFTRSRAGVCVVVKPRSARRFSGSRHSHRGGGKLRLVGRGGGLVGPRPEWPEADRQKADIERVLPCASCISSHQYSSCLERLFWSLHCPCLPPLL